MKSLLFLLIMVPAFLAFPQQPPATDIYLFDLKIRRSGLVLTSKLNITSRKGYDNQPFFHPQQPLLYYASAGSDGRTDVLVYNYKTAETSRLTQTPEREYSPTVTPDGKFISCIIQHDNGAQDLGMYPVNGGNPTILIENLIVGYHAWINDHALLLFVLGQPNTLRVYDIPTKQDKVLAQHVGRSLHRIPGQANMSFIDKQTDGWLIKKYNPQSESITTIAATLPGREDIAWTSDGKVLMSDGTQLYYLSPGRDTTWKVISMPKGFTLKNITRIAVSADGTKLAVVAEDEFHD